MHSPYLVLDGGHLSAWCRACPWRGKPRPMSSVDPLATADVMTVAEADWTEHTCEASGAPARQPERPGRGLASKSGRVA